MRTGGYTCYSGSGANLPEDRKANNFGYCWMICPFAVNSPWPESFSGVPVAQRTEHTTTSGQMRIHLKNAVPGWICWDNNCYNYTTSGTRYFRV